MLILLILIVISLIFIIFLVKVEFLFGIVEWIRCVFFLFKGKDWGVFNVGCIRGGVFCGCCFYICEELIVLVLNRLDMGLGFVE